MARVIKGEMLPTTTMVPKVQYWYAIIDPTSMKKKPHEIGRNFLASSSDPILMVVANGIKRMSVANTCSATRKNGNGIVDTASFCDIETPAFANM
mmetsp:Transcript_26601/g.42766  ORF Transcript_26601/g.42766 Transcript_26601/m.42766 type:complete len:95 (+) Transcript_26601:796-1080(+)